MAGLFAAVLGVPAAGEDPNLHGAAAGAEGRGPEADGDLLRSGAAEARRDIHRVRDCGRRGRTVVHRDGPLPGGASGHAGCLGHR